MIKTLRRVFPHAMALSAFVLSSFSVSLAQALTDSPRPKPASVSTVGTLRVEKYGSGSPAMIFIPGLSCGSWVWDSAVPKYAGNHAVYLVTLAGFDGLAAPSGPALDGADASLLQLITTQKLDRPILVGHSLGGLLAMRFGTEHAALLRGVVSVDALPVFSAFSQSTADQRVAGADAFAAQMRAAPSAQFLAQQEKTVDGMITDPTVAARASALMAKSDQQATAAYIDDFLRTDLRPDLPKLTVPTLEIAAVPTTPASFEGPQAATATLADRMAAYKQFESTLFVGAPNVTIVPVGNSRHFVMLDQPKALYDAIDAFIAGLPS
jgi:pimeloyl-ACP methyl ester carboxylesterase